MERTMQTLAAKLLACGLFAGLLSAVSEAATSIPDCPPPPCSGKVIRIVVGVAPGGPTDTLARLVAAKLSDRWGGPVVIDNRVGAAGNIAADLVAKSVPDGNTLLFTNASFGTALSLYAKPPFDAIRDFEPIALVATSPYVLVVPASLPAKTTRELIQLARSNPGKFTYASVGSGSIQHLSGELFKQMAAIDVVHVPYKGSGAQVTNLLAGQVSMAFGNVMDVLSFIKAGKLRALGVTGNKRSASIPEIPTIAESGLPGFEVNGWYGVFAPARTPARIITGLNAEIAQVMKLPDARERMLAGGFDPVSEPPEQLRKQLASDTAVWARVVREAGIKSE
jgi:tripartite-type tricarboxylate transporter receptor subunit TctC